jgi:hypothetical protein
MSVAKAIEAQAMMAAASCAFNAGVVGVGKPLTVAEKKPEEKPNEKPNEKEKPNENPKPKMRSGPTLGPRKAAKVSDIF